MAYASRYIFQFGSTNGTDYRITVSQDGYEGEPLLRHLGGSPVLRRDRSGHIWGTSLEIPAECSVDTEFAALYTRNPKEFLVTLDRSNAPSLNRVTVWTGYVSTELYSEPDIAPPYDVRITATDCLGELKSTAFVGESRTILAHLEHILAKTGLSLPIRTASTLAADSVTAAALFSTVTVDYSYLDGESDYAVLQAILSALNADITRQGDAWIIFRQTDISSLEGTSRTGQRLVRLRNESSGAATSAPISAVTSMQHGDIWPVGSLSSSIDPARSHGVIRAPYHAVPSALENPDMDTDTSWSKSGAVTHDEGGWYSLPSGTAIYQGISLSDPDYYIALKINARSTIWYKGNDRMSTEFALKVRIKATCEDRSGTARTMYFGNYDTPVTGTGHRLFDSPFWQNTEVWNELTVPAPSSNDERDLGEYELVIPFSTGARQTFVNWNSLEVYIYNPQSDTPILISHCSLHAVDIADGEQVTIYLDNGARGSADDVELGLSDTGDYSGVTPFFQGFATVSGTAVTMWSTGLLEADTYLRVMAQDHAMGWALPRLRKDGVLNVPKNSEIPLFTESGGIDYIIETFRWDLLDDELNMSMVSLPAVSLQVESMETAQYNTGSGGNGGGSSSNASMAQTLSGYATLSDLALKLNIADLKALGFSAGSFGGEASYDTKLAVSIKIPTTLDHILDGTKRKLSDYAKASELASLDTRLTTVEGSLTSFDTRITSLEDLFEIDQSTGAIRTKHDRPFYSNSWVSALGAGSGSGGGGGADLPAVWQSLMNNAAPYANEKIDPHHLNIPVSQGSGTYVTGVSWDTSAGILYVTRAAKPSYAFSEITGTASASQLPNIESLTNFSTRVYDATTSRTKNYVLAAPSNANGAATFRALVASDIPDLSSTYQTKYGFTITGTSGKTYNLSKFVTSSGITSVTKGTATSGGAVTTSGGAVTIQFPTAYSLPLAASGTRGGIQIGFTQSGKNYPVQLSSEKAYVNVPWTDTTYSAGTGLALNGTTFSINSTYQGYISNGNTAYGWGNHANAGYLYAPRMAYNYTDGFLVETNIATNSDTMFTFIIEGNSYDWYQAPIASRVQGYNYASNDQMLAVSAVNLGGVGLDSYSVFCYNGHVCLWFKQLKNFETFQVFCYTQVDRQNHATSITNSAIPTSGVTRKVNATPVNLYAPYNENGYLPLNGGTMANTNVVTNLNADLLDGYHYTDIINGNVASATQLQNTRTIWGQNFNGTANVYGIISDATSIEFTRIASSAGHGGYLDFHYNGSTADFTSRIVESASGTLSLNGQLHVHLGGNVGIGADASSTSKLYVNGNSYIDGPVHSNGYYVSYRNTSIALSSVTAIANDANAWSNPDVYSLFLRNSNNAMSFIVAGNNNGRSGIIQVGHDSGLYAAYLGTLNLNPFGGNVGIGTISPAYKLDVNGTARITTSLRIGDATISWDSTNSALHIDKPIYSDSWVSALGAGSGSGGGGGSTDLSSVWASLSGHTDAYKDTTIDWAHIKVNRSDSGSGNVVSEVALTPASDGKSATLTITKTNIAGYSWVYEKDVTTTIS